MLVCAGESLRGLRAVFCLIVLLLESCSGGVAAEISPVQFGSLTNFGLAGGTRHLAAGDLNGDGNSDLVLANQNLASVSVLLGTGDGAFTPSTNYTVGSGPVFVCIADFNGDGPNDIATANYSGASVSLLLGIGNGTFGPATNFFAGDWPNSVAAGDFNGDKIMDWATVNSIADTVTVRLGSGAGFFGPPVTNAILSGTNAIMGDAPFCVVTDDLNSDGHLDLAVAQFSGYIGVNAGNGDGTFAAPTNYCATQVTYGAPNLSWITLGDFDRDGRIDIATANYSSRSSTCLKGNGGGTFLAFSTNSIGFSTQFVTSGDFNGDGCLDLITANSGSTNISLLLGKGDASFTSATHFNFSAKPVAVAVSDFNRDGRADIAVSFQNAAAVGVMLNQSLPSLEIVSLPGSIRISWPDWKGYVLESCLDLSPNTWAEVADVPTVSGGQKILTKPIDFGIRYYRLKKP